MQSWSEKSSGWKKTKNPVNSGFYYPGLYPMEQSSINYKNIVMCSTKICLYKCMQTDIFAVYIN
jgi:hypothetical protein